MRIDDIINTKQHEFIANVLKNAYIHTSAEGDELIIICNPTAGYVVKSKYYEELARAIEEKLGQKYIIKIMPSDIQDNSEYPENKGELITTVKLNPLWTFDTFEMGKSNEMAVSLASQIANHSFLGEAKRSNNFLYLWGEHGVGKTHLLTAIAWRLLERGLKVVFFPGSNFIDFVVKGLTSKKYFGDEIKKLTNADAFLIDDVQYLSGKVKTQEIFKRILDEFNLPSKIAVFTADVPQHYLKDTKDEVTTRMMDGFTAMINAPDEELKKILFLKYLSEANIMLPDNILNALVSIPVKSVREVRKVAYYVESAFLLSPDPTLDDIKNALEKQSIHIPLVYESRIKDILYKFVEDRVEISDLQGKIYGKKSLKELRDAVIYEAYTKEKIAMARIAEVFHINRVNVTYIVKQVRKKIEKDQDYIENLKRRLSLL